MIEIRVQRDIGTGSRKRREGGRQETERTNASVGHLSFFQSMENAANCKIISNTLHLERIQRLGVKQEHGGF